MAQKLRSRFNLSRLFNQKKPAQDLFDNINEKRFPSLKKFLRGSRNYYILSQFSKAKYNHYNFYAAVFVSYIFTKSLHHFAFKTEYDQRKQPNPFIPVQVYKIRRLSYIYWEISRLSRGLPKTFTYSTWDEKAVSTLCVLIFNI